MTRANRRGSHQSTKPLVTLLLVGIIGWPIVTSAFDVNVDGIFLPGDPWVVVPGPCGPDGRCETDSSTVGFLPVVSWPRSRADYEYGPSILLENGTYYAFYCASPITTGVWDSIRLAISADGHFWWASGFDIALVPGGPYDRISVCDPSVVKLNGVYLMYHTCINTVDPPDGYNNNRICVAAADNILGPYHRLELPVVQDLDCPTLVPDLENPYVLTGPYCVGQPSAVVHNNRVYMFYSKHDTNGSAVYLATSENGIDFAQENNGSPVWTYFGNVDVKYDRSSGLFFLIQGEVNSTELPWAVSADGINWLPYDASRLIASNTWLPTGGINHNPGIAGDPEGQFHGMGFVIYGSSYGVTEQWGQWHLYRSDLVFEPTFNDCSQCVENSCDFGCSQALGVSAVGTCAFPGSIDPAQCCTCKPVVEPPDCSACASGCVSDCRAAGYDLGICAVPGSTNPSACCACF